MHHTGLICFGIWLIIFAVVVHTEDAFVECCGPCSCLFVVLAAALIFLPH